MGRKIEGNLVFDPIWLELGMFLPDKKNHAKKTTIIIHLWKPRTRCLWFRAVLAEDEKQKKIKTSWDTKSLKNRKVDGHGQWIVYEYLETE